jgi:hypothetical protein
MPSRGKRFEVFPLKAMGGKWRDRGRGDAAPPAGTCATQPPWGDNPHAVRQSIPRKTFQTAQVQLAAGVTADSALAPG